MRKLVTLKDKFAEYGFGSVGALRARRSDQAEFPGFISRLKSGGRDYLYDEEQLDHWFYKIYALKRRKPRKIGPRKPKSAKVEPRETFDNSLASAFIFGKLA